MFDVYFGEFCLFCFAAKIHPCLTSKDYICKMFLTSGLEASNYFLRSLLERLGIIV